MLDAKDLFIEEYVTDPVSTPEDKLVIEVLVPVKSRGRGGGKPA